MVVRTGPELYDIGGIWEDYGQPGRAGSTSISTSMAPAAAAEEIRTLVQEDPQFLLDYTDGRSFSLVGAEARAVAGSAGLEVAAVAPFYRPTWSADGGNGPLVPTGEYGVRLEGASVAAAFVIAADSSRHTWKFTPQSPLSAVAWSKAGGWLRARGVDEVDAKVVPAGGEYVQWVVFAESGGPASASPIETNPSFVWRVRGSAVSIGTTYPVSVLFEQMERPRLTK